MKAQNASACSSTSDHALKAAAGGPSAQRVSRANWLPLVIALTIVVTTAVRSAAEEMVQTCAAPPNSTMVSWNAFDETSGSPTTANLATRNTGIPGGAATFVPGIVGNAMHFDGFSVYVDAPSSIVTNFGPAAATGGACTGADSTCAGDFSIDLWIRVPTDLDDSVKTILDKRSDDGDTLKGYSFALSYRRLILQLADGLGNDGYTNYASVPITSLRDGNWHHVAVSVTRTMPNGIRWYHDGVALAAQQSDPTDRRGSLVNDSPLRIGANTADEPFIYFFNGDMDELHIFNRALSAQEVLNIFNAGTRGLCKP